MPKASLKPTVLPLLIVDRSRLVFTNHVAWHSAGSCMPKALCGASRL